MDGQPEVTIWGLKQYLWCFTMDNHNAWVSFLPWDDFSYNTSYHFSTGYSPFQIFYGHAPQVIHPYEKLTSIEAVEHTLLPAPHETDYRLKETGSRIL